MSKNVDIDGLFSRIDGALGYDPTKGGPGAECMREALEELKVERQGKLKVKAKEYLTTLETARIQHAKLKQQQAAEDKKFEKTVNQVLGKVEALLSGRPEPAETEDGSGEKSE